MTPLFLLSLSFSLVLRLNYLVDGVIYTTSKLACDDSTITRCSYLETEKRYKASFIHETEFIRDFYLICSSDALEDNRTFAELMKFKDTCRRHNETSRSPIHYQDMLKIQIKSTPRWPILNESLGYFRYYVNDSNTTFSVHLVGFKGIDIESKIRLKDYAGINFDSGFDLYKNNNQLVTSCDQFPNSSSSGFIFRMLVGSLQIKLPKNSKHPMCSLFFRHARIQNFFIFTLVNTFYLTSVLTFQDHANFLTSANLNSTISYVSFSKMYGIRIDSRLLNPHIFERTFFIRFTGDFNSIENEVFRPLRKLRTLEMFVGCARTVIRKQGIGWIKSINWDKKVNLTNKRDVLKHYKYYVSIQFKGDREFWSNRQSHFFDDEDFCLFVDFPFTQFVFANLDTMEQIGGYRNTTPFTCAELWLFQFYDIPGNVYYRVHKKLKRSNFTACLFRERIEWCQKSRFEINQTSQQEQEHQLASPLDRVLVFELAFIIIAPILSLLGIISNFLSIRVIMDKKNEKTMREKHYLYMSAYCLSNVLVCFTQIVSLMSECQFPLGYSRLVFCSAVRQVEFVQYVKIIFGVYVNSTCRLFSNFAYFGFSVCRLARIGKDHGKFIGLINDLSIKKYIIASMAISAGMAVVKPVQFRVNKLSLFSDSFPQPIFENFFVWKNYREYVVLFAFDFIFNILNYFGFVCVHLVVDIVLIRKLVQVLREKEEKMLEMTSLKKSRAEETSTEASTENDESKRRAVFMVVLNSTLNVCSRAPLMVTSLNDLRLLIQNPYSQVELIFETMTSNLFSTWFTLNFFCSDLKSCVVFESFGTCLYLFSLVTILFFLKRFDKNFNLAFQASFSRNTSKNKNEVNNK